MFTLLFVLLSGCVHDVNFTVLQPADVTLPEDVHTIGVLDRSRPKDFNQGVMDTIEGVVTGEAPGMDKEGAQAAVYAVVDVLRDSPRFDAAIPFVDKSRFPPDIFDKPLTKRQVQQICRQEKLDALVALDAFDTDSVLTFSTRREKETDSHGREINVLYHDATRDTRSVSSWRLYYGKDGRILDEMRDYRSGRSFSASGRTRAVAVQSLANAWDTARIVGRVSGDVYGSRIAPLYVYVGRAYYGANDPGMRAARRHVRAGDWDGAERLWRKEFDHRKRKIRGKAMYNTALALEVDGKLYQAKKMARKAATEWSNDRTRRYVRILDRRIADYERAQQQMKQSESVTSQRDSNKRQHPAEQGKQHPAERDDAPLAVPEDTPAPKPAGTPMTRPKPNQPMERPR